MGRLVLTVAEGQAVGWQYGYVRTRFDMYATEVAVYPINFVLQFYHWFRYKTYYRTKYEQEVADLISQTRRKAHREAKQYWHKKGTDDAYKEMRGALARGWVLTSSGISKVNDKGKLVPLAPVAKREAPHPPSHKACR